MPLHYSDETLRHFLLGVLPETEREGIEKAALDDSELLENIEALEDELILDYLQERLDSKDRSRFEAAYCAAEPRAERVAQMRALVQAAANEERRVPPPMGERGEKRGTLEWLGLFGRFRFTFAALAMVAAGGLIVWVNQKPVREGAVTTVANPAATLRLPLSATRSSGGGNVVLPAPGTAGSVRIELAPPLAETHGQLEARLGRVEAGPEEELKAEARQGGPGGMVIVEVPARVLVRGDYVLRLMAGGQPAATYQFRVD
ncbi:MAG: hypothetical protein U0Q16_25735 [Bryobacteraceae bacterium]